MLLSYNTTISIGFTLHAVLSIATLINILAAPVRFHSQTLLFDLGI